MVQLLFTRKPKLLRHMAILSQIEAVKRIHSGFAPDTKFLKQSVYGSFTTARFNRNLPIFKKNTCLCSHTAAIVRFTVHKLRVERIPPQELLNRHSKIIQPEIPLLIKDIKKRCNVIKK